ncbi:MAG TPA: MFS transporter [Gemmataceae bacterium]|nr:MFS transporter [Gemmataceae bacterium]
MLPSLGTVNVEELKPTSDGPTGDGSEGAPSHAVAVPHIEGGTRAFRRTSLAMFAAGFSTFALLYCVQPLLPLFAREFQVSPAQSSLSLSLTTALLALTIPVAGALSEAWGRKPVMVASLLASATLTIVAAFVPGWRGLLLVRAFEGVAFSGLPAVAMPYLSEEMHPRALGLAMGLYVGGTALGGMAGRLVTGLLADFASWRLAVGTIGALGVFAGLTFWRALPPSAHFRPRPLAPRDMLGSFLGHARDEGLPWLFAEGFLLMGCFVTCYNYIGFRLLAPPYGLRQAGAGAIFAVYLVGIGSSAWVGLLAGRLGRRNVFWATVLLMLAGLALALLEPLVAVVAGIAVLTFGFFGAHSVLSSWVGLRARQGRAQASSLYLLSYYLGASAVGWCGGLFWAAWGWDGVTGFLGGLLVVALLISLRLTALKPIGPVPESPAAFP